MTSVRRLLFALSGATVLGALIVMPPVYAQTSQSTNFRIDESSVGTSGTLNSRSANYGAYETTSDVAAGEAASSNYQIHTGSNTTAAPRLAFTVNSSNTTFGQLSPTTTSTGTATFSVLNYTTYGYVVQVVGDPPAHGTHAIPSMTVLGPAQTGVEQFGINLVANTSPVSLGANPDNGAFGYGSVTTNYNVPNKYYYNKGDIIARADKDSGITNYTVSYIMNVSPLTPGGYYTSNQTLVVVGTY